MRGRKRGALLGDRAYILNFNRERERESEREQQHVAAPRGGKLQTVRARDDQFLA